MRVQPGTPGGLAAVSGFGGSQLVTEVGVCHAAIGGSPMVGPSTYEPTTGICPASDVEQVYKAGPFDEEPRTHGARSESLSTHLSTVSNECRSVGDGDAIDDLASTSASSSESGAPSGPSSGVATPPPPEMRPSSAVVVPEEDAPDSLSAGLTTEQLWKFVAHVTNKSAGPTLQDRSTLPQKSQDAARLAFASASASLNAAASAYHGASTRVAARNAQTQSQTNMLFDTALFDSTVARPRTRGVGYRRLRQHHPQTTETCHSRRYHPRSPPPERIPDCPLDVSAAGPVTRSGAKRTAATAGSSQCQDISSTPPAKRRRGSIDKDQAASRPASRNLSTLFGLLGKNLEEGSSSDDKGEALDCEFWREFKKAMVLVAYLDKVRALSCDKYSSPPQFLSRIQVVCSACCSCPASSGRRSAKKRSDPTRPGRPAPEPRCVPNFISIPFWVYNQPVYRRILYKWHARQNGTEPITSKEFQCATRELSPRTLGNGVFFSSRVTEEMRSKEEPRFYFSRFLPSAQEKVDGALSEAEAAPVSVREDSSVSSTHSEETHMDKVQGGVSFDDREGCWYAKMKGDNHIITKRFSNDCPSLPVRQPEDILTGVSASGGLLASLSSSEQASSSASLYYEWVSKHFRQVSAFLGTRGNVGSETSRFCALQARKSLLQSGNAFSATAASSEARSPAPSNTACGVSPLEECAPCTTTSAESKPTRVFQPSTETGQTSRQSANRRHATSRSRVRPVPQSQLATSQNAIRQSLRNVGESEHTILKQCQLLLSKHRRQLSERLTTREDHCGSESLRSDATTLGSARPLPTEKQVRSPIFTEGGIAKLQELVRSTLGMLPDPHTAVSNNGQELRLLQQMRQYHMDMQRLVMNSAAKQSLTPKAVPNSMVATLVPGSAAKE
ncbi:ap2 domain transcription factor ap2ix-4 [Cystoisospora suis]|uniref:Ap2 domain transcription factor ap2ix-4 n=1 Tax=Cystoisospora suis TaxID=483139 RepID=A0A2C6L7T4_9APIC|nr:ap2 domain transcription factor ap2ix-4 [Cystoisospora suis]